LTKLYELTAWLIHSMPEGDAEMHHGRGVKTCLHGDAVRETFYFRAGSYEWQGKV
jgi:hypothetical protein